MEDPKQTTRFVAKLISHTQRKLDAGDAMQPRPLPCAAEVGEKALRASEGYINIGTLRCVAKLTDIDKAA